MGSKAYVSRAKDGTVSAVYLVVDDRHAKQVMRSLQRSQPQSSVAMTSVPRALKLMRDGESSRVETSALQPIEARHRRLRQG